MYKGSVASRYQSNRAWTLDNDPEVMLDIGQHERGQRGVRGDAGQHEHGQRGVDSEQQQ